VSRAWVWCGLAVCLSGLGPPPLAAREPLPEMPDYVFVVAPEEENLDVVFFGEKRPTLIRFRAQINGRGFRTAWDEFTGRLYDYLDTDSDRVLAAREARSGRWQQLFADPLPFRVAVPPVPAGDPAALDADPRDGKVSPAELARYLREVLGYEALGVQPGMAPDPRTQSAFVHLDRDGDGALSTAELNAAEELILRVDGDEDEMVVLAELRPYDSPFAGLFDEGNREAGRAPVVAESDPIVPLTSAELRQQVARRLAMKYEAGGFGKTDVTELERFLADPTPSLVIDVQLGRRPQARSTIALASPEDAAGPLAAQVRKLEDDTLVLDLAGVEIHLGLNDSVRDFRRFFAMRFSEADANKDGTLDRKEAEKARFFQMLFDPADRNGDERLSQGELTAYLDRSFDAVESRLMVTAGDSGRSVFDVLDVDRDNRLSRRELRNAARRLKAFDKDGDGRVALAELPRTFALSVGRGPFFRRRGIAFESYDSPPRRPAGVPDDAASWFRHMDRNQDGDVSPREFLGAPDDFRKLDADGDGLIDAREAAKGP
jgi:Ca2+-binding EF-hand superfamily protein